LKTRLVTYGASIIPLFSNNENERRSKKRLHNRHISNIGGGYVIEISF